jgi:transposase
VGYSLPEGGVPICSVGGEGERSDGLPGGRTPSQEPKKRSKGAAERDEFLRVLWRMELSRIDPGRLVFVDEMGTHTSLAPLYAYAPVGERAFFEVPRTRGKNTTLLTSMITEGMGPSMAVEGATTSRVFETYVERVLAPALRCGQVVVMDNLGAHRPRRIRELIEERGCELIYLPSYSPDFNPIEQALSKIKHLLRRIAARTKEFLIEAMGWALAAVSAQDVRGFFINCGYRTPAQQL